LVVGVDARLGWDTLADVVDALGVAGAGVPTVPLLATLVNIHTAVEGVTALGGWRAVELPSTSVGYKAVRRHHRAVGECALTLAVVKVAGVVRCAAATRDGAATRIGVRSALASQAVGRGVADAIPGFIVRSSARHRLSSTGAVNVLAAVPDGSTLVGKVVTSNQRSALALTTIGAGGTEWARSTVNNTSTSIVVGVTALELEI